MRSDLDIALAQGASAVIVDAVHGEHAKREAASLWEPPTGDRLPDGATLPALLYDSVRET